MSRAALVDEVKLTTWCKGSAVNTTHAPVVWRSGIIAASTRRKPRDTGYLRRRQNCGGHEGAPQYCDHRHDPPQPETMSTAEYQRSSEFRLGITGIFSLPWLFGAMYMLLSLLKPEHRATHPSRQPPGPPLGTGLPCRPCLINRYNQKQGSILWFFPVLWNELGFERRASWSSERCTVLLSLLKPEYRAAHPSRQPPGPTAWGTRLPCCPSLVIIEKPFRCGFFSGSWNERERDYIN